MQRILLFFIPVLILLSAPLQAETSANLQNVQYASPYIDPNGSGEGPPDEFKDYQYDCEQGMCLGGDCELPNGNCVPGFYYFRYCKDFNTICTWPKDCSFSKPYRCVDSDQQNYRAAEHQSNFYSEEYSDVYISKLRILHERFSTRISEWKKRNRLAKSNAFRTTQFNSQSRFCPNGGSCPANRVCKLNDQPGAKYICVNPEGLTKRFQATAEDSLASVREYSEDMFSRFQKSAENAGRQIRELAEQNDVNLIWVLWAIVSLSLLMIIMLLGSLIADLFQHKFSVVTLEKIEVDDIPLLIRRSQYRTFPLYRVMFRLDVRAYISPESWGLIRKYRLKNLVIYGSQSFDDLNDRAIANLDIADALNKSGMPFNPLRIFTIFNALRLSTAARFALNIRVKDLVRGKKVKSKNLFEVAEAEKVAIKACKSLHNMLILAETYDGREVIYKMSEVEFKGSGK